MAYETQQTEVLCYTGDVGMYSSAFYCVQFHI